MPAMKPPSGGANLRLPLLDGGGTSPRVGRHGQVIRTGGTGRSAGAALGSVEEAETATFVHTTIWKWQFLKMQLFDNAILQNCNYLKIQNFSKLQLFDTASF